MQHQPPKPDNHRAKSVGTHSVGRRVWDIGWYVRLILYIVVLVAVLLSMRMMRGRIPQAFGLTPIRVEAISVSKISNDVNMSLDGETDYSVSVRIVGSDTVVTPILLGQFLLETAEGQYTAFASDLIFARGGTLDVAPGDTLFGALIYSIPNDENPEELWWRP
jgi:hypothetical protein